MDPTTIEQDKYNNVANEDDKNEDDNYFDFKNSTNAEQGNKSTNEVFDQSTSTSRPQLHTVSELLSKPGCNNSLEGEANECEVR